VNGALDVPSTSAAAGGPALQIGAPATVKFTKTPEEIAELKHKKNLRQLTIGLCTAGAIAIGLLVLVNSMGKKPKVSPDEIATKPDDGDEIATGPIARTAPPTATEVSSGGKKVTPTPEAMPETATPGGAKTGSAKSSSPAEQVFTQMVEPDDGKMLWASPTTGKLVTFRCVPPTPQVMLIVRPADLIASGEGNRVLQALGPTFAAQRAAWETASGLKLEQVEQLILALHNNDAKFPRVSLVVRTVEPFTTEKLLEKWGSPAAQKEGSGTYYAGASWAYYISASPDASQTFVMGDAIDIKEVAKIDGKEPLLSRDVERLSRATDDRRHLTALFYPPFFFNDDGEPLFSGERKKLREPLGWLLGDDVKAGLVSLNFGSEFYLEMRMISSLDKEKFALASELRDRLKQIPTGLEDYFVSLSPPPYWKKIAFRYPGMISTLHNNLRVGVENEQAIINGLLPSAAAHNLVLGGELLISSAPGAAVAAAGPAPAAAGAKTIEEALQLKSSYSFDVQSLEFAMRDLGEDVKTNLLKGSSLEFAIKIIGDDLKLDGITRNQSIRDFKQENKTVAEILTALVLKANAPNVPDPTMPEQKLIWVIGPDPDNAAKQMVLITTRQMAEKKKYTLPAVFVAKAK